MIFHKYVTMVKIFYFADALADTFYSTGFVMSLCQLLSFLELFHIADGIEKARLLPRLIQVCITAQHLDGKKAQSHTNKVCVKLFFLSMLSVVQVMEKNLLLAMVIMLEEIQSKQIVCVLFLVWNFLDLSRYVCHSSV